jgi:hypothetical protein
VQCVQDHARAAGFSDKVGKSFSKNDTDSIDGEDAVLLL